MSYKELKAPAYVLGDFIEDNSLILWWPSVSDSWRVGQGSSAGDGAGEAVPVSRLDVSVWQSKFVYLSLTSGRQKWQHTLGSRWCVAERFRDSSSAQRTPWWEAYRLSNWLAWSVCSNSWVRTFRKLKGYINKFKATLKYSLLKGLLISHHWICAIGLIPYFTINSNIYRTTLSEELKANLLALLDSHIVPRELSSAWSCWLKQLSY